MNTPSKDTTTPLERGYAYSGNLYSPEKGVSSTSRNTTTLERGYAFSANPNRPEKGVSSINKEGGKRRKRSRKGGKWSIKYKRSINCRKPKGFSQKQHCKYGRRTRRR